MPGSVKSRLPKRCKITSLFTPFFVIWRNGDKKACYLHRFHGQTDGVHMIWFRINVLDGTKCIQGGVLFRKNVLSGTKQQIRSPPEQNREGRTEMLRFFPVPVFLWPSFPPDPCSSSVPGQRPGTRMTINEDAAQESERRLVDSYLRLGEISHLALQRDTITKHY